MDAVLRERREGKRKKRKGKWKHERSL
jgi:hypothetical protein